MMKKTHLSVAIASTLLFLGACGTDNQPPVETDNAAETPTETPTDVEDNQTTENGHEEMEHDESGDIPTGLKEATDPKYPVGTEVILKTDHMEGMEGAEAKVVGAFDTTVYSVSYTPTDGGEPVKDHKWVVHEELKEAAEEPLKPGDEATLEAKHMAGMEGAKATIDQAEETTAYMVDYTQTTDGKKVRNHKWVTEDELSPKDSDGGGTDTTEEEATGG